MTLKSIMIQLPPAQIEALDVQARRTGVSRSRLIREAIEASLEPSQSADLAARYAAAYPTADVGVDEWGDRDAWHRAAAQRRQTVARDPW